ncbi:MAG: hypothetical protein QOJ79_3373 [Actinomycetota bacterium]|jgi:Tfp pilus assembly protein PilX|nr:hypothetical protein [Actinomycetota bacterium]
MRRIRGAPNDEGAVLLLVLLVLLVFGIILGALFTNANGSERSTPFVRANMANVYAADAGIDAGLQRLRQNSEFCATKNNGVAYTETFSKLANGHDVKVTCNVTSSATSLLGAAGYAAVVLSNDADSLTQFRSGTPVITGPTFLSGLDPSKLQNPIQVKTGNVDHLCTTGGQNPIAQDAKIVIDTANGYEWNPDCSTTPVVPHILPPEPCASSSVGACDVLLNYQGVETASCRIFAPGTYTTAPALSNTKLNYFASGVYHFKGIGGWQIKSDSVVAGREQGQDALCSTNLIDEPTITIGTTSVNTANNGYGATFVFSGDSYINTDSNASLTINARLPQSGTPSWTQRLSIVALEDLTGNAGWATSSITTDIIDPQLGNTPAADVRGVVYAPKATLTVDPNNTAVEKFTGGLFVNKLHIGNTTNAIGLVIGATPVFGDRTVTLTSTSQPTAGEKPVTAVAVVTVSTTSGFPTVVNSWHNNPPDFCSTVSPPPSYCS